MGEHCSQIDLFADGQLDDPAAERFREHLGTCAGCQRGMTGRMQLVMAAFSAADGVPEGALVRLPTRRPQRGYYRLGAAAVGLLACAGLALVLREIRPAPAGDPELLALAAALPTRAIEARLARREVAAHRPYDVARGVDPSAKLSGQTLQALARIDQRGDAHATAAAWLLAGDPARAAAALEGLPASPEVDNDRAVIALGRHDTEAALALLERADRAAPNDPRIQFNQALAARDFGLPWLAAERLRRVAAHGEPGWAAEASSRAVDFERAADAARAAWREVRKAGDAMARGGPPIPEALARAHPGISRLYLYHAVRAAATPERVAALRPLAQLLDAGEVLGRGLDQVAKSDFKIRAPLAAEYLALFVGTRFDPPRLERLLQVAQKTGNGDIAVGALILGDLLPARVETLRAVADLNDPWHRFTIELEAARGEIARGDLFVAETRLQRAIAECHPTGVEYRCGYLEHELARLYGFVMHRVVEARRVALAGWAHARQAGEWGTEALFLEDLSQATRFGRSFPVARALLDELRLRDIGHCGVENYTALERTYVALDEVRLDEARGYLATLRDCGDPPQLALAELLIDLWPHTRANSDLERAEAITTTALADPQISPGDRAVATLGAAEIALFRELPDGPDRVERAILAAEALPAANVQARKVRSDGYDALIQAAARRGDFAAALGFLARDAHVATPRRCAVGVALLRDRFTTVTVGAGGDVQGTHEPHRTAEVDVVALSRTLGPAVAGCEVVDVLARQPLHGDPRLLPDDIAWRFRIGSPRSKAREAGPSASPAVDRSTERRLIVANVEPPAWLALPALSTPRIDAPQAVLISGAQATPARVLAELVTATEVEIHAHGFLDLGVSDVSFLALSPDAHGRYALTAGDIRKASLRGAPLVVLAACRAAAAASNLHEPWSLSAAFITAGARAVLASPATLADREADPFFAAVREGIRAGRPAAVALRDARQKWLASDPATSVAQVVLFE